MLRARARARGERGGGERGPRGERGERDARSGRGDRGERTALGDRDERIDLGERAGLGDRDERGGLGDRDERGGLGDRGSLGDLGDRGDLGEREERERGLREPDVARRRSSLRLARISFSRIIRLNASSGSSLCLRQYTPRFSQLEFTRIGLRTTIIVMLIMNKNEKMY